MPSIEIMGISNPDESGDEFRKQWNQTINLDAVNNMDKETLDKLAEILKKVKQLNSSEHMRQCVFQDAKHQKEGKDNGKHI